MDLEAGFRAVDAGIQTGPWAQLRNNAGRAHVQESSRVDKKTEPRRDGPAQKPCVFLSYARENRDEMDGLCRALERANCSVSGDWKVPPGPDWWEQILNLIRRADIFVLLATAASTTSQVVNAEIAEAAKLGKRIVTVVGSDGVAADDVHPAARRPNWIFAPAVTSRALSDNANFEQKLAAAVHTNFAQVEEHTRLLGDADTWIREGRPAGRLLKGRALDRAEQLLTELGGERTEWKPAPIQDQREFVARSRRVQRTRVITLTTTLIVGLVAAGLAFRAFEAASGERLARQLATKAQELPLERPDLRLLVAAEAFRMLPALTEAEVTLRHALGMIPKPIQLICEPSGPSESPRLIVSSDGGALAAWCAPGELSIFALPSAKLLRTLRTLPCGTPTIAINSERQSVIVQCPGELRAYAIATGEVTPFPEFDKVSPLPKNRLDGLYGIPHTLP